MSLMDYDDYRRRLVSWKIIPGEIGCKYRQGILCSAFAEFPIEDKLELVFKDENYSNTFQKYTFLIFNFVWRGSAKKFNIKKFLKEMIRKGNLSGVGPLPVRYNRWKFQLAQVESYFEP